MAIGTGPPGAIEVGSASTDGTLRYWLAKEAVRQGELSLGSQISALARLMASATSILGWSVTISLALTAAIASAVAPPSPNAQSVLLPLLRHALWPAVAAEVLTLTAAVCCVVVLWPHRWHSPGHEPALLLASQYDTELEVLEAMASGYAAAADRNSDRLTRLEKWLHVAWGCFVGAPIAGGVALLSI
jgi:hypothetical protein